MSAFWPKTSLQTKMKSKKKKKEKLERKGEREARVSPNRLTVFNYIH